MGIVTDWAVIDTSDGPMRMYMARPDGGTAGPGVLIVQDAFGLTDHLQDVSRRFAEEGFVALVPELYHRFATRKVSYNDPSAARNLRQQLTDGQVIDDLTLALRFLGARGEVRSGLVGAVGYGAGGRDAFLLATRNPDVLALVCYDGPIASEDPSAPINEGASLEAPALLFFGETDHLIPAPEIARLQDQLTRLGKDHEIVAYPGAGHGFSCEARPDGYDPNAAADAWTRAIDFLYERLEG